MGMKFIYFDVRGRGEGVRYLLAVTGQSYEDKRIQLGSEEWNKLKPDMPFGQLPVLEVDGKMIPESVVIARYLAKKHGLYGSDALEQADIEVVVEKATEFREGVATVFFMKGSDDDKAKAMEEYMSGTANPMMKNLEKNYFSDNQQYFVGGKLSLADVWFYSCLELMINTGKKADYLKPFPKLQALYNRVAKEPKMAEYLKNRKDTPF